MPLPPKQELFVEEWLKDFNASAAYKRAGYKSLSEKAVGANAARLIGTDRVQEAIRNRLQSRIQAADVDAVRVIKELESVAFSDLRNIVDFTGGFYRYKPPSEISEFASRSLSSVKFKRYTEGKGDDAREVEEVEFKQWPKTEALKQLEQILGMIGDPVPPPAPPLQIAFVVVKSRDELPLDTSRNGSANGIHRLPSPPSPNGLHEQH